MTKWQTTAQVELPSDIDFSQYKECEIEYEKSDAEHAVYVDFTAKVDGEDTKVSAYNESEPGKFTIDLAKYQTGTVTAPKFGVLTSVDGFAGTVTVKKVTFIVKIDFYLDAGDISYLQRLFLS